MYKISVDVLLETESDGDIEAVANKIEQLGTEFIWAKADCGRYGNLLHQELGEDLWQMWKGLYFAETGDRKIQQESKEQGNLRISGAFGTKIWDDEGIACVIKSSLIKGLVPSDSATVEVVTALCSEEGQKLIISLSCDCPTSKQELVEKTNIELSQLNEILIMFTENKIIEYVGDNNKNRAGYIIGGHCGIVAYMLLAAIHILNKKYYATSRYIRNE